MDEGSAARKGIDAILEHPFDRIALAHSDPITHDGRETLRAGCAWLKSGLPPAPGCLD